MRAAGPCGECGETGTGRYRCPRCASTYCSVRCCRTHRERCAPHSSQERGREKGPPAAPPSPAHGPWSLEDILGEEDEQDRVPMQKLKLLGESEELRALLLNPHLRQLLLTIDQAEDKSSLMRRFMQEPLFVEFADCCLRIVEPPEKENILPDLTFHLLQPRWMTLAALRVLRNRLLASQERTAEDSVETKLSTNNLRSSGTQCKRWHFTAPATLIPQYNWKCSLFSCSSHIFVELPAWMTVADRFSLANFFCLNLLQQH